MGRSIVNTPIAGNSSTRGGPGMDGANEPDGYGDRLLKLIPAEVIALFMAMDGVITDNGDNSVALSLIILGVGVFATWFYLKLFQKVDNTTQIIISMLAFAVWAINIGHGFQQAELIKPSYAALALLIFTFFAPKIPMGKSKESLPPL
ncbi:MAG: hypothetical protein Alis3KO_04190 [Aliiglaciecola sp.]|uniref:hypothetical protein n=1 Tax=Aliiglaciecola sp. M165 TaxID=2593649 RepID=UPI00117DDD9D|nr:hypothetical protein [Aliiglaciecola sp. M165]TRY29931.1 hypothetical protein FM019_17360 [Aliiglaciecola sp. M165]